MGASVGSAEVTGTVRPACVDLHRARTVCLFVAGRAGAVRHRGRPLTRLAAWVDAVQLTFDTDSLYAFECAFSPGQMAFVWIRDHLASYPPPFCFKRHTVRRNAQCAGGSLRGVQRPPVAALVLWPAWTLLRPRCRRSP